MNRDKIAIEDTINKTKKQIRKLSDKISEKKKLLNVLQEMKENIVE